MEDIIQNQRNTKNDELVMKLESVLFWKAEPTKISELIKILNVKESSLLEVIHKLELILENHGISIIKTEKEISLVTSPRTSELIQKLQKEDLTKNLSKATLETLNIILYRGPVKRVEIDYIRGVNSQFTIRTLLIRGLIQRKQGENDERAYVYNPTIETLAFLGIKNVKDLPEYESVNQDIDAFLSEEDNKDNQDQDEKN